MDWFPFYVCDLSSPKISAASSHAFGAWVRALGNCYKHENGGCYEQCSEHSDRQWMSIAGVDREEIASIVSAGLATWEGANLRIDGYDKEQEKKATSRKEKGAKAAGIRWSNARSNARSITLSNTEERKGEEKKGEGEEIPARDPSGTTTEHGQDDIGPDHVRGDKWLVAFKAQWEPRNGRQYGKKTASDAKASSELGDLLKSFPDAEALDSYSRRREMIAEFFETADAKTVSAGFPFSWFVAKFRGLMIPKHMRPRPVNQSIPQVQPLPMLGRGND